MRVVEIPPNPSPLIESLRDLGYSLGTALADIIDNSITAGAQKIRIFSNPSADNPMIGILDDGTGMSEAVLVEAMRLGTRSPLEVRDQSDLGRFGLGLKTASFSQCRKLSVMSRVDGVTSCAQWDLDHVARSKKWEMRIPDDPSAIPWSETVGAHGTLVVWENMGLDEGEDADDSDPADLVRELDEARSHLELVFHRFLSSEPGHSKMDMEFNKLPLEPFDPFHSDHLATQRGPVEFLKVGNQTVRIEPFTLPHHARVSQSQWDHYGGAEGYVRNQGFYVYRERRLIIHGTWFGLARQTELTKLARVRVDIPNSLDQPWKIDVKKASAQLPPSVRDRLRRIIERLGAAIQARVRVSWTQACCREPCPGLEQGSESKPNLLQHQYRAPDGDRPSGKAGGRGSTGSTQGPGGVGSRVTLGRAVRRLRGQRQRNVERRHVRRRTPLCGDLNLQPPHRFGQADERGARNDDGGGAISFKLGTHTTHHRRRNLG